MNRPTLRIALAAFFAMLSVYFFAYFQRAAVPGMIFDELQTDLALSATSVASLGSLFTWVYGAMQIGVGMLTDRFGGVRTLLVGGLLMAMGALLFPLSHSIGFLFAARLLTGFGSGFIYLSIIKELDRLFGARHFTVAVGVMLFIGYSGGMAASLPFERAVAAFGWRHTLLAVAILMLASLAVAAVILRSFGREPVMAKEFSFKPITEVVRNRACWPSLASCFISFPVFFVIQTVLGKKFLQDFGGLSSHASAAFILIMTVVSALSAVSGGYLPRLSAERRKPWLIAGAVILVLAVSALLLGMQVRVPGWAYLGCFVLLAMISLALPSGTAVIKELNRPEFTAAAISVANSMVYLGCGTLAQAGGWILDHYRSGAIMTATGVIYPPIVYKTLFIFLTVLALLNLLSVILIPETRGRNRHHETGATPILIS